MTQRQLDKTAHNMVRRLGHTDWQHPGTQALLKSVKKLLSVLANG